MFIYFFILLFIGGEGSQKVSQILEETEIRDPQLMNKQTNKPMNEQEFIDTNNSVVVSGGRAEPPLVSGLPQKKGTHWEVRRHPPAGPRHSRCQQDLQMGVGNKRKNWNLGLQMNLVNFEF